MYQNIKMIQFNHKTTEKVATSVYGIYLLHRHLMNWMPLQWTASVSPDDLQAHNWRCFVIEGEFVRNVEHYHSCWLSTSRGKFNFCTPIRTNLNKQWIHDDTNLHWIDSLRSTACQLFIQKCNRFFFHMFVLSYWNVNVHANSDWIFELRVDIRTQC